MQLRPVIIASSLVLSLTACAPETRYRDIGALGGAAGGGFIGSAACGGEPACIIAGSIFGFLAGGAAGIQLDRQSQVAIQQTTYRAIQTGRPQVWRHPQYPQQRYSTTVPQPVYQNGNGSPCREYQTEVVIDGKVQRAYGTACADGAGGWKITQQ